VNCEVATMNGLSAHADRDGLLRCFTDLPETAGQRALLVHGEVPQSEALAARLGDLGVDAKLPEVGQPFVI
jgi:Cft2 family RNA processing exonuclease